MNAPHSHGAARGKPVEVTVGGDARIAFLDEGGDEPPILFSNSLAADWRMWDAVCSQLGDIRRIRYDTRGHGRSSPSNGAFDISDAGADALAVLDACGVERALVCGLSLGGAVGMWMAIHAPDRIVGLCLANTAMSFPTPAMWESRASVARADGMAPLVGPSLKRWFTPAFATANPDLMKEVAAMIETVTPEGYALSCELLKTLDLEAGLAKIACPVKVVAGASDPSTPPTRAQEIVERIPGAELVVMEAAHMSAVEQPDRLASTLRELRRTLNQ
ncbi:alpha/beta fold hydrolase [Aquamicrobium sp. LC103]|uniref:alpha/beta fold hydrolase n=1 Tax=Aquamicrobium sp. LC103 TaxID=1120658 RepID=UPI00069B97BD|nr:alpha/beta fold hydrolase [Aquamicrobium sp. LC103]TKT78166.1 alpha/beta fold hydrolase [Aquamicrobium sp. LC103]